MPSKRIVERYRSPVSGNIARIFEPAGASLAIFKAPARVPPEDIPHGIPSLEAKLRAASIASVSVL